MSAAGNGIGPVSVRYAAQIRELLYAQAVDRMAAEQEAARAAAADARKVQPPAKEPVKVDVETKSDAPPPAVKAEEPAQTEPGQLVDIQA